MNTNTNTNTNTNNTTVHVVRDDGHPRLSTERGTCDRCGVTGWVGDFPGEGGLCADAWGIEILCDDCAEGN